MKLVFVLQHVYEIDDCEEIKIIGVYSTRENASSAIERLSNKPGFCDHIDGFRIDSYKIDKDSWLDGFVTV